MAKVAKLINNVRVTELDALSDAMEREYKAACGDGFTMVAKDTVLKELFVQLIDLSVRNTTAIKQDSVISTETIYVTFYDDGTGRCHSQIVTALPFFRTPAIPKRTALSR